MELKLGNKIIFKDESKWTIKEIFEIGKIKDKIYQSLHNSFSNGAKYRITLKGKYSEIFMSETQIQNNIKP